MSWQTVRERECIDLDFQLDDGEIRECLRLLRVKTLQKGIYGGNGWANYASSYFNDCYRFAKAAKYALKQRGTALVVIGNSILQGVIIPTDRSLGKIAEAVGLELVDIHVPRAIWPVCQAERNRHAAHVNGCYGISHGGIATYLGVENETRKIPDEADNPLINIDLFGME
jgi:hypothetical protein